EHDRLEGVLLAGERGGLGASFPADDDAWKAAGEHDRLVAAVGGSDQWVSVLPDHDDPAAALPVATRDDPDAPPARREPPGEPEHGRGLPRPADRDVADTQDPGGDPPCAEPPRIVETIPDRHHRRVRGGRRDERSAEGARSRRRRLPGAPRHRLERARHHAESGSASAKAAEVRRAAITFTCRSIAPRPLSTSTRARRPMSIARRGSLRSPASAQARLSVELTRSAPPPAMSRSTTSRVFAVWGPTSTGHPARAGSITLCPPAATRLPPTKAATARG